MTLKDKLRERQRWNNQKRKGRHETGKLKAEERRRERNKERGELRVNGASRRVR